MSDSAPPRVEMTYDVDEGTLDIEGVEVPMPMYKAQQLAEALKARGVQVELIIPF